MVDELRPGDRLDDRYRILEEIGRGGFGVVYRAVQEKIEREVAIKVLHPFEGSDVSETMAERFRREAVHTSRLNHPNVITLFDFGQSDDGRLFIVTELLEGEVLTARLERQELLGSTGWALKIGLQIAKALAEAHAYGIAHGDLKPDNVFLSVVHGGESLVKVLDFSIARLIGDLEPARQGTLRYMSPEQFQGRPIQAASDVYAAGLLIYECLMGLQSMRNVMTRLAGGEAAQSALPLPLHLEHSGLGGIIRRATEWAPEHRFKDGAALLRALGSLKPLSQLRSGSSIEVAPEVSTAIPSLPRAAHTRPDRFGAHAARQRTNPRAAAPPPVPRSREQAAILDVLGRGGVRERLLSLCEEACRGGQGRAVVLEADFGCGKTRFARWLALVAQTEHGALCGSGQATSGCFEALSAALLQILDVKGEGQRDLGEVLRSMEAHLGRPLSEPERVGALSIFGWLGDSRSAVELVPVVELLVALAEHQPVVLWLGALETASEAMLELISQLAAHLKAQPSKLLVLLTLARDEAPRVAGLGEAMARLEAQPSVARVVLGRLDEAEALGFARQMLGEALGEVSVDRVAALIASRSFGNPLYIKRLARYLVQGALLEEVGAEIRLVGAVDAGQLIPPVFSEVMSRRVERLFEAFSSRRHVQLLILRCALIGESFSEALLRQVLAQEARAGHTCAAQTLAGLDNLVERLIECGFFEAQVSLERDGEARRHLCFRQPLTMQFLQKRADYMLSAPEVHRIQAEVKRRFYGASGQLEPHREEVARHESLSKLPAAHGSSPPGWVVHRDCWVGRHRAP